jgi:hypothetical protein
MEVDLRWEIHVLMDRNGGFADVFMGKSLLNSVLDIL